MNLEGIDVDWTEEFNGAITVCDLNGKIVFMNNYAIEQFEKYGGADLLGSNLLDCHPEPSKTKLTELLKNPADNMYTTEKSGIKRIILQTSWKSDGKIKGIVEISFRLDAGMPNFIRK